MRTFVKSARDVGQEIRGRIVDLGQELLRCARRCDEPAGAGRLGEHEAAVGVALGDRVADVVPAGHLLPVGEEAARGLRPAFEQVADQAAGGEAIVVIGGPTELVHQDAEGQGAVDAAAGDDDVGAQIEGSGNRYRAEIGICRGQGAWQRGAGDPLKRALFAQGVQLAHQVVAFDDGDPQRHAQLGRCCLQRQFAGAWIDAPGIAGDADATALQFGEMRLQVANEIGRKSCRRIL
jgi:hypothetical protein